MRWKPYADMSRLEQKMFWAVRESAMLHELPQPEVDAPGSVKEVRWPAEHPEDCKQVLLAWLDDGLIGIATTADDRELPQAVAREILADHESWSPAHCLVITDAGMAALD